MTDQQRQSRDQSAAMRRFAERAKDSGQPQEAARMSGVAALLAAHASGVKDPAKLRAASRRGRAA